MRINNDIWEVVFMRGDGPQNAWGFIVDKTNAELIADQMIRVQNGESAMYIFRDVEDQLLGLAADTVTAIRMKVHTDAEEVPGDQAKDISPKETNVDSKPQGQGEKPAKVARRPRLIGLDQSN